MAITCGFYNYSENDAIPREYDAIQFGQVFDGIITDGVYETYKKAFIVKASENAGEVIVQPGRAWFNGTWTYNDADLVLTAPSINTGLERIDALVLDVDQRNEVRDNTLVWVQGTARSMTPQKPTLINEEIHHQYPLCYIHRYGNKPIIGTEDIENTVGTSACPFVTGVISSLSIDDLIAQWDADFGVWERTSRAQFQAWEETVQSDFETWMTTNQGNFTEWLLANQTEILRWFNNLETQLDENTAVNLQNQITKIAHYIDKTVALSPVSEVTVTFTSPWIKEDSLLQISASEPMVAYTDFTSSTGSASVTFAPYLSLNEVTARLYISNVTNGEIIEKKKTMTVKLDLSESDPSQWGTYLDDAAGLSIGDAAFDEFFGHYPCILQNGVELGKLQRNDFTKYENGSSAPITTLGNDVMIYFPKRGLKVWKDDESLYVSITEEEGKTGYVYNAFTYLGQDCDGFYKGAYEGYVENNNLYSVSGQANTTGTYTIQNIMDYVAAKGTNYNYGGYNQQSYLQAMWLIKYKGNLPETVLGMGAIDVWQQPYDPSGYTNDKGMDWGESTGKLPIKIFGIENFFGNTNELIGGLKISTEYNDEIEDAELYISVSDGLYTIGSGNRFVTKYQVPKSEFDWTQYSAYGDWTYYIKDVLGISDLPFINTYEDGGSSTTYFGDTSGNLSSNIYFTNYQFAYGGHCDNPTYGGPFHYSSATSSITNALNYNNIRPRLMYHKVSS